MQLVISPMGVVQCIYDEAINLAALGPLEIQRASQVEPNADGAWQADLSKMLGPILGPFELRSHALLAERVWLETHWLGMAKSIPKSSDRQRNASADHNAFASASDFGASS